MVAAATGCPVRTSNQSRYIVGPVASDLHELGETNKQVVLATAFYSGGLLDQITLNAKYIRLMVRLDLGSIEDWAAGRIAPDALLRFIQRHVLSGVEMDLYIHKSAHAKIYVADKSFLCGSANLSLRGFAGLGNEMLWLERDRRRTIATWRAVDEYGKIFERIDQAALKNYVYTNRKRVALLAKSKRNYSTDEDRLPHQIDARPERVGTYSDFLAWLLQNGSAAAQEISDRADWKGQLSGHINRNFHGIRQFFLAHAELIQSSAALDPNNYRLWRDSMRTEQLRRFVLQEAADEGSFILSVWRTYLPESCGGKPKSGGGTSGNLNRMIPLVAQFIQQRLAT